MKTAVWPLHHQHAAEERAAENADVGSGFDQAGAAQYLIRLKMLRQDRIFDGAEES